MRLIFITYITKFNLQLSRCKFRLKKHVIDTKMSELELIRTQNVIISL